ncbi:MAG TPA: hypothetical protein VNO50_02115 [Pyrinomonadaceae bacterium]|nr:hypothetical protein [Pyrinomonadaceae bacterium]
MGLTQDPKTDNHTNARDRRYLARYLVLTIVLMVPLVFSFAFIRNLYPFAASTMMLRDRDRGSDYYILRGETLTGETIDLPPINLTDALSGRHWSLVSAAVENKSFQITSLHPENARLAAAHVGDDLPRAARLDELLRAWGLIYNSRLPEASPQRLRSVRLDAYRWKGEIAGDSGQFVESWRALL